MTEWKILFSQKDFNFSDIKPRAKTVRLLCFLLDYPFESTLVNWEVMSSILSHDRMKNPIFLENFNFSDFKPGCNKFYSGLRRNSLHGGRPPQKSPLPPWGEKGKSPTSFGKKLQYLGKFQIFRHPTENKKCSSALFLPRLPPSKAPS